MKKEVEKLLQYVQKPARYIGGELNAVVKDKIRLISDTLSAFLILMRLV